MVEKLQKIEETQNKVLVLIADQSEAKLQQVLSAGTVSDDLFVLLQLLEQSQHVHNSLLLEKQVLEQSKEAINDSDINKQYQQIVNADAEINQWQQKMTAHLTDSSDFVELLG